MREERYLISTLILLESFENLGFRKGSKYTKFSVGIMLIDLEFSHSHYAQG